LITNRAVKIMLKKSENNYNSALDDFNAGRFDTCVSGLYYSCFQAVVALMSVRGVVEKKHTHVRSFVNKELSRTGLISIELAKFYNRLLDEREDADYSSSEILDKEAVMLLKANTEVFLQRIVELINKEMK
jgi:uncharacterized protein (UPF0332 family)